MNILRIIYDWPDENVITEGLAPAPYGLSVAQAKLGHEIFVLCGNLNGKTLKKFRFSYNLEGGNIVVYNLPRGMWRFGPFLSTSLAVLPYYLYLRLFKKIDIIHNQGHVGVWFLLYKLLFRFIDKIPVIGHIHITAKGREEKLKAQGTKLDLMTKYFEYPIHKLSDYLTRFTTQKVVTVSKDNIDELVDKYGYDKSHVRLLETAVDIHRFKKEGETVDFGFPEDSKVLMNLGRLSKRKNIDVIVESLALLPTEYKLILVGKWEEEFRDIVEKIIKDKNLTDRVKYLGAKSYFEVDKYYRSCDIFLLPSSYEGLPKVIVETLGCGSKAIASGFTMDKEIPNMYFLDRIDSKSLSELIKKVDAIPNKYEGTRKVLDEFYSWDAKARDLEDIYRRAVGITQSQ